MLNDRSRKYLSYLSSQVLMVRHLVKLLSLVTLLVVYCALDLFFLLSSKLSLRDENLVMIIRLDAIGDFIIWQSCGRSIYDHYKELGKKLILVCDQNLLDLAVASDIADEIITIDVRQFRKSLIYRIRTMFRIALKKPATVIQPTFSRALFLGDSIICASGSRERIGCEGDYSNTPRSVRWIWDLFYTNLIKIPSELENEFQKNRAITEKITNKPIDLELAKFDLRTTQNPLYIENRLKDRSKKYVVIFPGASWSGKQWPVERFAEVTSEVSRLGFLPVIAGGATDKSLASRIRDISGVEITDLTGSTSLCELISLIQGAELLLTNDTSAVHVAASQQRPAICLLGGGHFGRFAPYPPEFAKKYPVLPIFIWERMSCFNCNWRCVHPRSIKESVKCIKEITTGRVINMLKRQLSLV